jgi:predicted metalloprotease
MKWQAGRRSDNIEDRRGMRIGGAAVGGGAILVALVMALFGAPEEAIRDVLGGSEDSSATPREVDPKQQPLVEFVSAVLANTEDTWSQIFEAQGRHYESPKLVLFTDAVASACGQASTAVGPFYCPEDHKLYLDLNFFSELDRRFGAPGDFAQAYVVAHEVGHHVQNQLGVFERVHRQRGQFADRGNRESVLTELQADCLAGVWANHADRARKLLEPGDLEEGLRAASSVGDDTLQRRTGDTVSPDSFTHGTSAQRVRWFRRGMESGKPDSCDTFSAAEI